MEEARARAPRTCVRCGRRGVNAFRRTLGDTGVPAWVCTHAATCLRRMRSEHRSRVRSSGARPRTSPIAPPDLADKPATVVGSRRDEVGLLAQILQEYLGIDVDPLPLTRRSLEVVSRRDLGLIVVDLHVDDPIALLNELGRRLSTARRRGVAAVVCHSAGHTGPAIERLAELSGATRVLRPHGAGALIDGVVAATGSAAAHGIVSTDVHPSPRAAPLSSSPVGRSG